MNKSSLPHSHGEDNTHILEYMPDALSLEEAAGIFQQMGDPSRLRILWLLCHCEECGINIAAAVNMSSAAVSHHLKTLKLLGLIQSRRPGKEIYYRLAGSHKVPLVHRMVDDCFHLTCPSKGG